MGLIKLCLGDKALLCQIILVIMRVPTHAHASPVLSSGDQAANDKETCDAPECKDMANIIRRQMGYKEPCDDFHNYVCGNWTGDKELNTTYLKKKAVITLAGLLENATLPSNDSKASKKLVRAYQSCVKIHHDKTALKESINNVIAHYNLTNKTWPITENEKTFLPTGINAYVEVLKRTGPRPVFSYSISTKKKKPVILLTKPSEFYVFEVETLDYGITSNTEEGTSDTPEEGYQDYADSLAKDEDAYRAFITETIALLNKSISTDDVKKVVDDIVKMEKSLSNLASQANHTAVRNMNLSQLSEYLGDQFPMSQILQRDFEGLNIKVTEEMEVLIQYLDYYKTAVELLKCSSVVELSNYILWTAIRKMAEAEGTPLHKIYLEFKHNTSVDGGTGKSIEDTTTFSLRCLRQLLETDVMYTAGAHYYVKAKFNESDKNHVLKVMEFVNSSFMHVVENNTWMSEQIKNATMIKLRTMTPIIGYPNWMLNETIIDGLYRFVPYIRKKESFVQHFHYLLENNHKQSLLQLKPKRYFEKTNEDIPLRSHAYYNERTQTIVYPAAAIVTHYRRPPIPRSVNYGTIGTILAQLLATSIERYSDQSKETGAYNKDNWDNQTAESFCNKSSCLNNTVECNDTHASPINYNYEKFHDYLGVRVSYQAMVNSKENYTLPYLLPDTEKRFDTESKIFYASFGSLYCPFSVNEKPVNEKSVDEKLLVESRADDGDEFAKSLNEIVYTNKDFNNTFNCTQTPGADSCNLMPPAEVAPPFGC